MDFIYKQLVEKNDELAASALSNQVTDPTSKYFGGIIDETGIARASHHSTPVYIAAWATALVNPDSRFYHSESLAASLELAASLC